MQNMRKKRPFYSYIRIIGLFLIVIQSIGIRFFSGQGTLLSLSVFLLSITGLANIKLKDYMLLLVMLIYLCINKLLNPSFEISEFIYQISLILVAYIFLLQYRYKGNLLEDFYVVVKIMCFYGLAGYTVYMLLSHSFVPVTLNDMKYKTFAHLFYVADLDFDGLNRNVGLCWEPGLLQLMFNVFLFLNIKRNASKILLFACLLGVISTFSTAGYIILGINFVYFLTKNFTVKKSLVLGFGVVVLLFFFALIEKNITAKFNQSNTSGLVRLRDFNIGIDLINEKPIFGHGLFTTQYLMTKPYVSKLESSLFSDDYLKMFGEMSGGYTNGLLGLASWFGLPVAFILFYLFYKNKIIDEDKKSALLFFLIYMITFISEPITYTSFYLLFPFSAIVLKKGYQKKKIIYKKNFSAEQRTPYNVGLL